MKRSLIFILFLGTTYSFTFLMTKSRISNRSADNFESPLPSVNLPLENSNEPTEQISNNLDKKKEKRKRLLRSLIRNCGKLLGVICEQVFKKEIVYVLKRIPKVAENLIRRIDVSFKSIEFLDLNDGAAELEYLSNFMVNDILKTKCTDNVPTYIKDLYLYNAIDKNIDMREIIRNKPEKLLNELFIITCACMTVEKDIQINNEKQ